ncbi:MAG: 7-cyano-7-deazaguanine synthase QueC [Cytophagales bacterium]|nr:7-cyano-7-deazaguanine synthase QueC [Cytophagales bacterium]
MSRALILLSGGQDSTTCLYWAKQKFDSIEAVGFNYGQRHLIELDFAKKTCDKEDIFLDIISLKKILSNSALTNEKEDFNKNHPSNPNLPNSFVPGRNLLFLSIATSIAYNKGIENIVIGVCETDFSGYPDCREDFIKSMEKSIYLATEKSIEIHTPLMKLDKAQTWKLAKELGCLDTIIKSTMTDYNGSKNKNEWGLGNLDNPASILRHKGYIKAKKNKWI